MTNYDLNIWDVWAYETDYRVEGGFRIDAYELVMGADGYYQQVDNTCAHQLWLRKKDAEVLGVSNGDDYWSDAEYLLREENMPRRVRIWLEKLVGGVLDAERDTKQMQTSWAS